MTDGGAPRRDGEAIRILFLDIDGVLNSWRYFKDAHDGGRALTRSLDQIDKKAVRWLNEIVSATGAKVVISSTWRLLHPLEDLKAWLADKGFAGEVIGKTPDLSWRSPTSVLIAAKERGHEIDAWLTENPGTAAFVILDDGADMAMHMHRLVLIDARKGLKPKHVSTAVALLSTPPAGGAPDSSASVLIKGGE